MIAACRGPKQCPSELMQFLVEAEIGDHVHGGLLVGVDRRWLRYQVEIHPLRSTASLLVVVVGVLR
eukprot:6869946-Prorocentrum_lima.AAC.1